MGRYFKRGFLAMGESNRLASGLIDGIKGFFGIHSPSTVFAESVRIWAKRGRRLRRSMDGVSADMTAAMGGAGQLTAAEAVRAVNEALWRISKGFPER